MAICIPSLNAYSNIAASARLMYSLQQSSNFSKISFCSSVIDFSRSSWCLDIYFISCFISGELFMLSSCGMMFLCHSSFIMFIFITSGSTTQYHISSTKSRLLGKIKKPISNRLFFALGIVIFLCLSLYKILPHKRLDNSLIQSYNTQNERILRAYFLTRVRFVNGEKRFYKALHFPLLTVLQRLTT